MALKLFHALLVLVRGIRSPGDFPRKKPVVHSFDIYLPFCQSEQATEQTIEVPVIFNAVTLV